MKSGLLCSIGLALVVTACAQTDAGITTSVKTQLAADDTVKARNISVETNDGVVTLTGQVESVAEETQALHIARATKGVRSAVDQLTVVGPNAAAEPGSSVFSSDATITAAVKAKLLADPDTSGLKIDVDTKDRMVTLSGEVKNAVEKTQAVDIARRTDGVLNVTDQLTIRAN